VPERLRGGDEPLLAERGHDRLARVVDLEPREARSGRGRHPPVLAYDGHLLEAVATADLEVAGVVAGSDLQRARAEVGLHVGVGDDLEPAAHERKDHGLAHEARVAGVVGVHGHRRVGEHRLRSHGGDGYRPRSRLERVVDGVQRVLHLALLHLEVRDRRARARVPVDHVVVAVHEAALEQADEHVGDRTRVGGVHREALVGVVGRDPEAAQLLHDRGAVLIAPAPHALDERLAADLLAARALRAELLLDLDLGGDAGVVRAEDPLRAPAAHAREADERVLDGAVQRVPHVEGARHVGRRDRDGEAGARVALGLGVEDAGLVPAREHRSLDLLGVVAGALLQDA
jgi:hypothetical protein